MDHNEPGHKCLYCASLAEVEANVRALAESEPEREDEQRAELAVDHSTGGMDAPSPSTGPETR